MKKLKKAFSILLLLGMFLTFLLPFSSGADESRIYALEGTWILDDYITPSDTYTDQYFDYKSSDLSCYFMAYLPDYNQIHYCDNDLGNIKVYDNVDGWVSDEYRIVKFEEKQYVNFVFYTWFVNHATKVGSKPSGVVDDLNIDSLFDLNDYPADPDDMSVNLIQVAEGEKGDLYVYVYQPADSVIDLKATFINMSTHHYEDATQNFKLYSLSLVDSYGTLDKYVVNDFKISSDIYRYYNISTIYRSFDENIDNDLAGKDDTTTDKGYPVGKCIAAYNYNDATKYEAKDVSVVDVEIKSAGIVRYSEGYILKQEYCDSHFVAFKVDNYDVKDIFDATIQYKICDYSYSVGSGLSGEPNISNEANVTKDITEYEKGSVSGGGIFGYDYEWPRIQSISEFKEMLSNHKNEKIVFNEGTLNEAEFVFNFLETDYSVVSGGTGVTSFFSKRVTDVVILRLHFATDTGVYNLGVVSDIVSDDGIPDVNVGIDDNLENTGEDLEDFFKVVILLISIFALICLFPYIVSFLSVVAKGVSEIFKLIWSAIIFPFEFIASLFNSKRK